MLQPCMGCVRLPLLLFGSPLGGHDLEAALLSEPGVSNDTIFIGKSVVRTEKSLFVRSG